MKSYRDLLVWQKSIDLVVEAYKVTGRFPKDEQFALVNQMRRAVVSIPSNIAEGYARRTRKEYIQFVQIAFGSGAELETQLLISRKLGYLSEERFKNLNDKLSEILRMLNGLLSSLRGGTNG